MPARCNTCVGNWFVETYAWSGLSCSLIFETLPVLLAAEPPRRLLNNHSSTWGNPRFDRRIKITFGNLPFIPLPGTNREVNHRIDRVVAGGLLPGGGSIRDSSKGYRSRSRYIQKIRRLSRFRGQSRDEITGPIRQKKASTRLPMHDLNGPMFRMCIASQIFIGTRVYA